MAIKLIDWFVYFTEIRHKLSSVYSRQKARAREILGVEKKANISVTRLDIKTIFG